MNLFYKLLILFALSSFWGHAQDFWEQVELLQYTPRYFGPNAFLLPELRNGQTGTRWEAELRGEYHYYTGDQTKDLYARLFVPIANGRAGLELSGVIIEDYRLSQETQEERHAFDNHPFVTCLGDLIISSFYQILQNEQWCDIMASVNLKTASGGRLCDARFTDAVTYWFDLTAGRTVCQSADHSVSLRLQGMAGFYCWMTNDLAHRQNDAFLYGVGISGTCRSLSLNVDYAGFQGYENNGDRPQAIRTKLNIEYRKNILSLRYRHGLKDNLYDTYSVAYIRCF
ncbi:MAG: hypothetical protein LBR49_03410 [Tannerella sp.]|jgi:hypothetical protein|nr:hypothetical protein [Tannerella sp.]